jgi:chromosome partitioning protein
LVLEGKKVLLIDTDPQGSLSICLGYAQPDKLDTTLATVMGKVITDNPIQPNEGVDLMPANIELSGMEVSLVNAMSRETT